MNLTSTLIRWSIVACALILTSSVLTDLRAGDPGLTAPLAMAVVLGFVTAAVRPMLACVPVGFRAAYTSSRSRLRCAVRRSTR